MGGFKRKFKKEVQRTKAKIEKNITPVVQHAALAVVKEVNRHKKNKGVENIDGETNKTFGPIEKLLHKPEGGPLPFQKALTLKPEEDKIPGESNPHAHPPDKKQVPGIHIMEDVLKLFSLINMPSSMNFINKFVPFLEDYSMKNHMKKRPKAVSYPLKNRGRVLIIENVKFKGAKQDIRYGSEKDTNKLETFFQELNFKVIIKRNLKAEEMVTALRYEISKEEGCNEDCFILFILSHGIASEIYGSDSKTMKYSQIFKEFNNSLIWNDEDLPKPKLIYIQACQPFKNHQDNQVVAVADDVSPACDTPSGHFYIMYATIPGNYAFRNTKTGSRFIQSLIDVYKENYLYEDIETMGISIKQRVYKIPNNDNLQIAVSHSSLPMRMYLTNSPD